MMLPREPFKGRERSFLPSGTKRQKDRGGEGRGGEDFHLQSSWRIADLTVAGTPLGEIQGTLTGEGNQLRLESENKSPGGTCRFIAKATAHGDWPMVAEGEYFNLRADPWIRAFFNREFPAAVTLGGSLHAQGYLRTPAKIELQSDRKSVV